MKRVFLLHGGLFSTDGVVTSAGMNSVASRLSALPDVAVKIYLWANWTQAYHDIMAVQGDKVILIGYSGGGMKATWIANGCVIDKNTYGIVYLAKPRIDLLIAYDPSPPASLQPLHDNVKRAICYHNTMSRIFNFGLGGGALSGPHVETVNISEMHLAVQYDSALHNRTLTEVQKL